MNRESLRVSFGFPPQRWFRRSSLTWIHDRSFCRKLPISLRTLAVFCRAYFWFLPKSRYPRGAWFLYALLVIAKRVMLPGSGKVRKFDTWTGELDVSDARTLLVLLEVRGGGPISMLDKLLSKGATFIDIGANHGTFAALAARIVGSGGFVFAFEPQARFEERLRKTFADCDSKIDFRRLALGACASTATLFEHPEHSGRSSLTPMRDTSRFQTVTIETLDRVLADFVPPGEVVIKIDTEGHELDVLRGGKEFVKRYQPTLLCEVNVRLLIARGESVSSFRDLLSELGYRTFRSLRGRQFGNLEELEIEAYDDVIFYPLRANSRIGADECGQRAAL